MPQRQQITDQPQGLPEEILADVVTTFKALSDSTQALLAYLSLRQLPLDNFVQR